MQNKGNERKREEVLGEIRKIGIRRKNGYRQD